MTTEVRKTSKIQIFINMLVHGYPEAEAQEMTEITDEQAIEALKLIG